MPTVGERIMIHRDPFAYISHPSIAVLNNGDWLAAFNHSRRREPRMHPPTDPLFRTLTSRSSDGGATWDAPVFAPDFDWSGTECPGIAVTGSGTLLLTQFRFGWYPPALGRKRKEAGENISICLPHVGWTEDFEERDWQRAVLPWVRGYHGLYVHRSTNGGLTYDQTVRVDTAGYRDGYTRVGVRQLSSGRLVYVVTEHHRPCNRFTYAVSSDDDGRSWTKPTVVCDDPDRKFGEPDVAEVAPGELYCVLRETAVSGYLFDCRSTDGGATWSPPTRTSIFGHPGQLTPLADGRLLCTYGRRTPPFGIRAAISEDGGRSWLMDSEIIIRNDLPNGDLGYPTTIEYAPGRLFCTYYGQEPDGLTCVMGAYVEI
jgi:hypothetical protein